LEETVVDPVVRKNRDRPFRPETAIEKSSRDPFDGIESRRVRNPPPARGLRAGLPLGQKNAIRRCRRPIDQMFAKAPRIGAKLLRRAQNPAASGERAGYDFGGSEGERRKGFRNLSVESPFFEQRADGEAAGVGGTRQSPERLAHLAFRST
jgi:hypothetical protein